MAEVAELAELFTGNTSVHHAHLAHFIVLYLYVWVMEMILDEKCKHWLDYDTFVNKIILINDLNCKNHKHNGEKIL